MKNYQYAFFLLFFAFGCQQEEPKSDQKALLTLSFLQSGNPALSMTVDGLITTNQVTATLPPFTILTALKASFTVSPLATVTVNGVRQESGITTNDFSRPLTYRITAENGSSIDYTVTVTVNKSAEKDLLSFAFLKANNSTLPEDIPVSITPTKASYLITIPTGTNISALKPTFTTSKNATVTVNNVAQTSGVTPNNFNQTVSYRLTAEDGSTKDYSFEGSTQVDIATIENAVKAFIAKYNVPGMSIAITKDERLVYAKGYGMADKEKGIPVTTSSLFRLASVSKPITAIAALKLIDDGKLSLDQKVFGATGILGTTYGKQPYSQQLEQITVRHLLSHTAGGDAWNHLWNYPTRIDPFYQPEWIGYTNAQVISATIDTRPVTQTSGSKYVYSNVGINIVGRVIEKVTGVKYDKYVQDNILKPIGIDPATMKMGGTTLAERVTDEVIYYNPYPGYDQPYDFSLPRMDAHSGWITNAVNLVRLLSVADGMSAKKDILSSEAWKNMVTPTPVSIPTGGYAGYGLGWNASNNGVGVAYWHAGGMAGTATYWLKIGAYTFAILINTRSDSAEYYSDIDKLCYQMTADLTLTNYMKGDQFDVFFK